MGTVNQIIEAVTKLSPQERHEVRVRLAALDGVEWLDDDDPLSEADRDLLEARLDDLEKHPEASIPWREAMKRLEARYGQ